MAEGREVRVVDHYIRLEDGTTTWVRSIGGLAVEVEHDVPVVWPEPRVWREPEAPCTALVRWEPAR